MMKITTKLILVLFMCLIISCATAAPPPSTVVQKQITSEQYNFDFYANHLSKGVFPQIEKTIKPYKKFLTQEECKKLANEVFDCIWIYINNNNLYISKKPTVQVFKLSSKTKVAFVLRIEIHFLDKESSFKDLVNTVIFTKKFLIFFGKERTGAGI